MPEENELLSESDKILYPYPKLNSFWEYGNAVRVLNNMKIQSGGKLHRLVNVKEFTELFDRITAFEIENKISKYYE